MGRKKYVTCQSWIINHKMTEGRKSLTFDGDGNVVLVKTGWGTGVTWWNGPLRKRGDGNGMIRPPQTHTHTHTDHKCRSLHHFHTFWCLTDGLKRTSCDGAGGSLPEGSVVEPAPPVCGWKRPHFTCKFPFGVRHSRCEEPRRGSKSSSFDPTQSQSAPGTSGTAGGPGRASAAAVQ